MKMLVIESSKIEEAEVDCSAHTHGVNVHYVAKGKPTPSAKIVGALLRVLAEHTDGRCAVRGATDSDLAKQGAIFRFTSEEKRGEFLRRFPVYLSDRVRGNLTTALI